VRAEILRAGAVAGTLDILAAFALSASRGGTPAGVLRYIASGLMGSASLQGGQSSAALGLALHFAIATGAAAVYALAARRIGFLMRHPVPSGLAYGVAVYFFMALAVVPLSRVAPRPFVPSPIMIGIHMLCVGLPIALVLARAVRPAPRLS
jgi:hypothetical protein